MSAAGAASAVAARIRQLPGRGSLPGGARTDIWLEVLIVVLTAAIARYALREFAAPDYKAEMGPPITALRTDGWSGYIDNLPGYPGAAMIELIPAQIALWFGATDEGVWRTISAVSVATLGLAVASCLPLLRATDLSRTGARIAVCVALAPPTIYMALRIGHPEEVMSTGLLLGAVVAAAREKPIIAGFLLGLACGKAWAAVAAMPVFALLLPNFRRVLLAIISGGVAILLTFGPPFFLAPASTEKLTQLGGAHIFSVGQIFWFFGDPIPDATVVAQRVPQPRLGPEWTGTLSHPLIFGLGTAVGLIFAWVLFQHLRRSGSLAALRADGASRSQAETVRLISAALFVMAGILYFRAYLDTWNVPYYLMPAIVLGAIAEAMRGRPPIVSLVAAGILWKWHYPGDLTIRSDPDIYTIQYLAWTIPASLWFLIGGFRLARGKTDGAELPPDRPGAEQAAEPARSGAEAQPAGA